MKDILVTDGASAGKPVDPHKIIAARVFGIEYDDVTKTQRQAVKTAVFSGLYSNKSIRALLPAATVPVCEQCGSIVQDP